MKGESMTESTATTKPVKKFAGIEIASELTKTNYFFLFFNTFIIGMFMSVPSVLQPAFLNDIINIDQSFSGSVNSFLQNMSQIATLGFVALIGALAALISASLWVTFATWKSLPVSTTHAIVGAMIGFGIVAGGFSTINWGKLGAVVLSWVISPIFSLVVAFVMFKVIVRLVLSKEKAFERSVKLSPYFIGSTIFIVVLSFLFKTPLGKTLSLSTTAALSMAFVTAVILGYIGKLLISRFFPVHKRTDNGAEGVFKIFQIGTACYVALA